MKRTILENFLKLLENLIEKYKLIFQYFKLHPIGNEGKLLEIYLQCYVFTFSGPFILKLSDTVLNKNLVFYPIFVLTLGGVILEIILNVVNGYYLPTAMLLSYVSNVKI